MPDFVFESVEGAKLIMSYGEEPPKTITYNGHQYHLQCPAADLRELRDGLPVAACPVRPSQRDGHFVSHQLPRWDKHHKGSFSKEGKPQFTSREEAREYSRRVSGETNAESGYGELDD